MLLRRTASLQKVRRAIGNLRDLGEGDHLAYYRLVPDAAGNIQLLTPDEAIDLVSHPGQGQLLVMMGQVIEPFLVRAGVVIPHLLRPRALLSVDPRIQGGTPVIAGTRVPYDAVAGLMREDVPADEIKDYYPSVSADAAGDALDFALYVDNYAHCTAAA